MELPAVEGVLWFFPEKPNWILLAPTEEPVIRALESGTVGEAVRSHSEALVTGVLRRLFKRGIPEPKRGPMEAKLRLFVYLTNSCNLCCKHCFRNSGKPDPGELQLDDWNRLLGPMVGKASAVFWCGGEPTVVPFFQQLVVSVKDQNPNTEMSLLTNGLKLKEFSEHFLALFALIQVSLDGPTPESNDTVRGIGTFSRVLDSLRCLKGYPGSIRVNMTMISDDVDAYGRGFKELTETLQSINPRIVLNIFTETRSGRCVAGCTYETTQRRRRMLASLLRARGVNVTVRSELVRNVPRTGCGYGSTLTFDPQGNLFACGLTDGPRLGCHCERSPEEWLDRLNAARESATTDCCPVCRDCVFKSVCGGVCRVQNYRAYGEINKTVCDTEYRASLLREMIDSDLLLDSPAAGKGK